MKFDTTEAILNLEYNTKRSKLIIPDYGRHMQSLVDHICQIQDRAERTKAAYYAIDVMGGMNPHLRDVPDFQHKLWDQLYMMSGYSLDVEYPFPVAGLDELTSKPPKIDYPQNHPKYRFYGNNITYMINEALKFEEGELKEALIMVIANHMKKSYLSWNKDTVKDEVIFEHLYELSNGKINLAKQEEELSTTANLIQVNRKQSNKSNYSNNTNQKNNQKNNQKKNNHQFKGRK